MARPLGDDWCQTWRRWQHELRLALIILGIAVALLLASPASAGSCAGGRSNQAAMWYSIAHPGLGEYYLQGWGHWSRAPQQKFWYGWIPGFGWPGYLQVKSAIDAYDCKTNDELAFK